MTGVYRKPLWEMAPLYPLERLPTPLAGLRITVQEYMAMLKSGRKVYEIKPDDRILKKVVMSEIEKIPDMWAGEKNTNRQAEHYATVGAAVYARTGNLLNMRQLTIIFKFGKDALRNRLRTAIVKQQLSPEKVEEQLWHWSYYGFVRFYRRNLLPWELFLKRQVNQLNPDKKVYTDIEDDDKGEIIAGEWFDESQIRHAAEINEMERSPEGSEGGSVEKEVKVEAPIMVYQDNSTSLSRTKGNRQSSKYYQQDDDDQPPPLMHPTEEYAKSVVQHRQWIQNLGKPQIDLTPRRRNENNLVTSSNLSSRSSPTVATDFAQEMLQITYQATRISREQPECVKLLRKALFDTVLAFDQKEYKCVADLFRDLADRAGK